MSPSDRKASVHRLLADYESISVPEVWLIFRERRVIDRYMLTGPDLERGDAVSTGMLRPTQCPADVSVDELWKAFHGE
jgi:hypothetical protein